MVFKVENKYLKAIGEMVAMTPMNGSRSRHRQRFIRDINEQLNLISAEREELIKEFAVLDETGEALSEVNGSVVFSDEVSEQECVKALNELQSEEFILEGEDKLTMLKKVYLGLEESDVMLSGEDAVAYDLLMENIEEALEA